MQLFSWFRRPKVSSLGWVNVYQTTKGLHISSQPYTTKERALFIRKHNPRSTYLRTVQIGELL